MAQSVKEKVQAIRLQYNYMAPALVALFESEKNRALENYEDAVAFLEKATDIEALAVLSELSLRNPLDTEGHKMMMHLSCKVFTLVGIPNLPDFIYAAKTLSQYEQDNLEQLKRKIREQQFKRRGKKL